MAGDGEPDRAPSRRPVAKLPLVVGATLFALAAMAIVVAYVDRDAEGEWGCDPDLMAQVVGEPSEGGGTSTEHGAYVATVAFVVQDGWGSDRYLVAMGSGGGPDRFDPETGRLWVNGRVRMEIATPTQLADGTWVVLGYTLCSPPPPVGSSPGPTPSPEPSA